MGRRRGRPPHDDLLTPAEWRTVNAVRHGLTNREIAGRRGVSLDAVKFHVANAIGKLGVENRKALRKWRGAPRDSVIRTEGESVSETMSIVGLGQVARTVSDIEQSTTWYRDVLGLKHLYTFDKLAFFDCGGTRLMLSQNEELQPAESILYLRVPDIEAAYSALEQSGVETISAPHMIHRHEDGTEEWMAFFKDPDDRPLAIMATSAQVR
jgi:DNA-binding CsgD family transcriptional regulator/catechol 2,3-dioxygenase-like lactoylglutathione lyase family enzyme